MATIVDIEGLRDAETYFKAVPAAAQTAASVAINQVLQRSGMSLIRSAMMDQIAFPKGYLSGDRLSVSKFAKPGNLEGVIKGRGRATSLARFAQGQPLGRPGISVRVNHGGSQLLRAAWLVKLNKGASFDEDNYNVGLAVRIKPGDNIRNKYSAHSSWLIKDKVALLYGPSVDQVFRNVADELGLPIANMVAAEFFRQLEFRL
jgi:hypothetical protein